MVEVQKRLCKRVGDGNAAGVDVRLYLDWQDSALPRANILPAILLIHKRAAVPEAIIEVCLFRAKEFTAFMVKLFCRSAAINASSASRSAHV